MRTSDDVLVLWVCALVVLWTGGNLIKSLILFPNFGIGAQCLDHAQATGRSSDRARPVTC